MRRDGPKRYVGSAERFGSPRDRQNVAAHDIVPPREALRHQPYVPRIGEDLSEPRQK